MAIDPNIKKKADDIRTKIYGREVRESLASGLEAMSSDVVETVDRQDEVEGQFQDVIENTTDKDVISAPEIIAARNGEANLKTRLDKENQEVTAQLAQTETMIRGLDELTYHSDAIQLFINNHDTVRIPKGNYIFDKVVNIPSNRTITIDKGAKIRLKDGCNQYIFQNADTINGNENISITGGEFDGRGSTQTRVYGTSLQNSYYGFGFHFHKVKNLTVKSMKLNYTRAWAIAHMNCDGVIFDDIEFLQDIAPGGNADGVTGQSSNIVISNIRGYTSDDLVAVVSYGAQMGANELHYEPIDTHNITVDNITALPHPNDSTAYTYKAVAVYQRFGKKMKNLTISNVKGTTERSSVLIWGSEQDKYYYENININNISCDVKQPVGVINFTNCRIDTINISNISGVTDNYLARIANFDGIIDNLNISNVDIKWEDVASTLVYDKGIINNINFSNISSISKTNKHSYIYEKDSTFAGTTTIRASNINLSGNNAVNLAVRKIKGDISINSDAFMSNKDILTPRNFDKIWDVHNGLISFYAGSWSPVVKDIPINMQYTVSARQMLTSTMSKINFDTKVYDDGNSFNSTNSNFVASKSGRYSIFVGLATQIQTDGNQLRLAVFKNNIELRWLGQYYSGAQGYGMVNGGCEIKLLVGDVVDIRASSSGNVETVNTPMQTYVSIRYVSS